MTISPRDGERSLGATPLSLIKDAEMLARVAVRRGSLQGLSDEELRRRIVSEFEAVLVREGCEEMMHETLIAVVQRAALEELDGSRSADQHREDPSRFASNPMRDTREDHRDRPVGRDPGNSPGGGPQGADAAGVEGCPLAKAVLEFVTAALAVASLGADFIVSGFSGTVLHRHRP